MEEECKGVGVQPMSQERRHCGGTQGRASVTGAPDHGGMHSLIGVLTPRCAFGTFLVAQKGRLFFLFPDTDSFVS